MRWAIIMKFGHNGSGSSTSSPGSSTALSDRCNAWTPPAVTMQAAGSASQPLTRRTLAASASRRAGMPAFDV
jgi:hypothetical protein